MRTGWSDGGGVGRATTVTAVIGALVLFAGCGTSDANVLDTTGTTVVTEPIDFAEGAFERNTTTRTGDGAAAPSSDPSQDTGSVPAAGDPSTTGDAGPTSTTGGDATTGGTTATTVATSGTTIGTSGGTTGSSVPAADLAVGEGLVRIGDASYPFTAQDCDIDGSGVFVFGRGTSSDGIPIEVDITAETTDLDGDGTADLNFDILVLADVGTGVDASDLPEFYATKVESAEFDDGEDITVTIDGQRVFGGGPIQDLNGVAAPSGTFLAMTYDVRCG